MVVSRKMIIMHNSISKQIEKARFYAVATLKVINNATVIPIDRAVTKGGIVPQNSLYGV